MTREKTSKLNSEVGHDEALSPTSALSRGEAAYRWVEFSSLFFFIPALFSLRTIHIPFLLLLYTAFITCLSMLLRDPSFDRRQLWHPAAIWRALPRMLGLYAVGVIAIFAAVQTFAPDVFLSFPNERPGLWLLVMVLYPVLSVWPQNVIYRCFIFHRYRGLFGSDQAMIAASALAFCFGHIIFQNWLALALTLPGGVIFAATYSRTRSAFVASFEHAMYGCLVFTAGLGQSLYYAAIQR